MHIDNVGMDKSTFHCGYPSAASNQLFYFDLCYHQFNLLCIHWSTCIFSFTCKIAKTKLKSRAVKLAMM